MAFLDKSGLQRFWEIILSKFVAKEELSGYVAKEEGKGLSSNDYTDEEQAKVANINNKVDKEEGKSLSSNDYTTAEKQKLESLTVMDEITNAQIDEICGATIVSGSEVNL